MLNYGDSLDVTWDNVFYSYIDLIIKQNYNRGDTLCKNIKKDLFSPVLVVNSDNYLDIEYRFKLDNVIYTKEETKQLQNKLKG